MARRQVTQTRKDNDGDITALCNAKAIWSPCSKAQAIREIENRTHNYFVKVGSNNVDIKVVHGPSGKYLRTDPDRTSTNNLDDLPDC